MTAKYGLNELANNIYHRTYPEETPRPDGAVASSVRPRVMRWWSCLPHPLLSTPRNSIA
jgi:hypothetical protein